MATRTNVKFELIGDFPLVDDIRIQRQPAMSVTVKECTDDTDTVKISANFEIQRMDEKESAEFQPFVRRFSGQKLMIKTPPNPFSGEICVELPRRQYSLIVVPSFNEIGLEEEVTMVHSTELNNDPPTTIPEAKNVPVITVSGHFRHCNLYGQDDMGADSYCTGEFGYLSFTSFDHVNIEHAHINSEMIHVEDVKELSLHGTTSIGLQCPSHQPLKSIKISQCVIMYATTQRLLAPIYIPSYPDIKITDSLVKEGVLCGGKVHCTNLDGQIRIYYTKEIEDTTPSGDHDIRASGNQITAMVNGLGDRCTVTYTDKTAAPGITGNSDEQTSERELLKRLESGIKLDEGQSVMISASNQDEPTYVFE